MAVIVSPHRADFNGVWAKILRFKEHRDALHGLVQETFKDRANRATLGLRYKPLSNEYVLYVTDMPDLEEVRHKASLILGDAVHNLRSALDHTAFQLALWNKAGLVKRPRRVLFPIVGGPDYPEPPEKLWADAAKRWLSEVHPNHRAVIESFQAHKRPEFVPNPAAVFARSR